MANYTGTSGNDTFTGTDAAESIIGNGGADTLAGAGGNDTIWGDDTVGTASGKDSIDGGGGDDSLLGGADWDTLVGGAGDDVLSGGAGVDSLVGGAGNDTYYLPSGDHVVESAGSGIDTVVTDTADFSINQIANVENLTGISSGNQNLYGSALDNVLTGSIGNDSLRGAAGNDTLDGGAGADDLSASVGDDTYVVDNAGDIVLETYGQGTDTVRTSLVDYSLGANVENLTGSGAASQRFAGNALANAFTGNDGNDTVLGGAGADLAVFRGARTTYSITSGTDATGVWTQVADADPAADGDDGTDRLYGVETLRFQDATQAVETVTPEVHSVAATGAGIYNGAGSLGAGKVVTLTVNASKALTVAGSPTLTLSSGATAAYTGGSGTAALTFSYTVASGQNTPDLAVSALNTPSGSAIRDSAGNAVTFDAAGVGNPIGTLRIDTAAPPAPTSVALAADTGASSADGTTSNAAISGFAEAGSTVTLKIAGTAVGTGTADGTSGAFSITPTSGLVQGPNTVAVSATDAAGNTSSLASITFTYDTASPGAPSITGLTDDQAPATGTVASGGATNDATPTLVGTAEANSTVSVFDGGTLLGTANADAGGAWSFTAPALGQGPHSFTARAADAAGNQGAASAAYTATVDTTAPAAPAAVSLANDTGASTADGITADPTVTGTAEAGATVTLKVGAATVGTGTADGTGRFSIAPAGLADGAATVSVTATDAVGNTGAATTVAFTLDRTAPGATTIGLARDTGAAGDGISADPALSGTASDGLAGQTVAIKDGAAVVGTAVTGAGGAWSFANAAAADGAHSWTAQVADAAGNLGPASGAASATLDRAADADVSVRLVDAAAGPGGASVALDLAGLDAGSTAAVTFTGADGGSVTRGYTANGAAVADVSGLRGDVSAAVQVVDAAGNAAAGQGGTLAADPVCFYPGTLVATPAGEVAVEALRAGDLVLTADGRAAPIRWLGRQTVSTRFADPLRVLPVRIAAGALGENLPRRDLLVSADHALLLDGALVQAGALVNGATVRREARVPEVFTYWHVELADHALVLAEGVAAESFIDNVARLAFDNWAEHGAAAEPAPIAELALPRAKSHRQVPSATRRRLAQRAATLAGGRSAAA